MKPPKLVAHHSIIEMAIERTRKQIRLLEANGAREDLLHEEWNRLRVLKRQLPWRIS